MVADGFQVMIVVGDVLLATFSSVSKQFQVFFDRDDHRALLAQFGLKFGGQLLVGLVEGLVDVGQGAGRGRKIGDCIESLGGNCRRCSHGSPNQYGGLSMAISS